MQPNTTHYPHSPYTYHPTIKQAPTNQFRAGFNIDGPFVEVGFPGFYGNPFFGAGFGAHEPYIDDEFPGWFFGSPYLGPGPFSW